MWILGISLVVLAVVARILGILRDKGPDKNKTDGELTVRTEATKIDPECCGLHEVCERNSLLTDIRKSIAYYDDEELDQYIGNPPHAYTPIEVEQFRDVLYTMKDAEVAGWVRSLQLRGINLPDEMKDETFLIIGEQKGKGV
ncbi:hypothetical protein EZS27_012412 [termite gut metagenome]|uniref:Phospholipase n=1 Tax=termite gut metagenome TaxID=433724 RepID=A0A5J4S2L7_9ZZZZ